MEVENFKGAENELNEDDSLNCVIRKTYKKTFVYNSVQVEKTLQ